MNEGKLKLALAILSGRKKPRDLNTNEFLIIGYDDPSLRWRGAASSDEVLERAEEIVFDVFCQLLDKDG